MGDAAKELDGAPEDSKDVAAVERLARRRGGVEGEVGLEGGEVG